MTSPIPDDTTVRRRTWIIAGVLSVAIALLGVGIAFAVLALRRPVPKQTASYTPVTSGETTSAPSRATATSTTPTSSVASTASADATSTASTPGKQIVHAARIAYRYGGRVYVANENATGDMAIADSTSGAFSLSPDGRTLAVMVGATTATDHAVLIDVETQAQAPLGYAVELPAWAPDSSWVAYTAQDKTTGRYSVHRINRDGTGDTVVLTSAADPQIAPDGEHIAYTTLSVAITNSPTQTVQVYDLAARTQAQTVPDSFGVASFAFASDGLLYFTTSGTGRALRSASPSLSQSSFVAALPTGTETQTPGRLFPSPDASMLLFSMTGDDGYSRIAVADIARKKIAMIAARLDEAPLGWLLDGSAILYIEGNAYNQESTSLLRMNADGSHRVLVKNGASL